MTEKDRSKEIVTKVAAGAVAGAAALATTGNPVATVVASGATAVLGDIIGWATARRDEYREQWWQTTVDAYGDDPERAAREIRENLDNPDCAEAVLRAVRKLDDFVHDAAIPALGALTAEYLREKKAPDAFFRGVSRMLADCDAVDLSGLREVLRAASELGGDITFGVNEETKARESSLILRGAHRGVEAGDDRRVKGPVDGYRIIHLLTHHGLASDANVIGGIALTMTAGVVERLARVLAPVTSPDPAP